MTVRSWIWWLILGILMTQADAVEIREFRNPQQQQRYEALIEKLRCLVCQNQSLADSDADLARDLRTEVYEIIQAGQTDEEALEFLTDRYGDFVLYDPPVKGLTVLLWGGPWVFLALGLAILWQTHRRQPRVLPLDEAERARLKQLQKSLQPGKSARK